MKVKPTIELPEVTDEKGNVFSIIALVSRALKKADMKDEAAEFVSRAYLQEDYYKVLALVSEYVEIK